MTFSALPAPVDLLLYLPEEERRADRIGFRRERGEEGTGSLEGALGSLGVAGPPPFPPYHLLIELRNHGWAGQSVLFSVISKGTN